MNTRDDGLCWRDDPVAEPAPLAVPAWLDIQHAFDVEPEPLDFVLPGYKAGSVGSIVAAGATGKTMLALQLAVHIAGGADTLALNGTAGWKAKSGRVLYLSGEDPSDVLCGRLHAIGQRMSPEQRQRVQERLHVAPLVGYGARIDDAAWRTWIEREAVSTRLMFVDTLRRFHSKDENDGGAMAQVLSWLEQICRRSDTSIVFAHHVNKASALNGGAGEQGASRGSSVLTDNVRWQVNLATMNEKEAKAAGIHDDKRKQFVRLAFPKVNYGPPISDCWFRRGKGGVLEPMPSVAVALAQACSGKGGSGRKAAAASPATAAANKAGTVANDGDDISIPGQVRNEPAKIDF